MCITSTLAIVRFGTNNFVGVVLQSCEKRRDWSEELGCLPSQLSLIADDFVRTLEASARSVASCPASLHIDRKPPHHVWQEAGGATCQCGVMTTDDVDGMHDRGNCRVLDPFETSVKAIANAVAISNMAICIEHYVQDNNWWCAEIDRIKNKILWVLTMSFFYYYSVQGNNWWCAEITRRRHFIEYKLVYQTEPLKVSFGCTIACEVFLSIGFGCTKALIIHML